jgi:hypothetical protein
MADKARSGQKQTKQSKKKEANLGQKEARQQQQGTAKLSQMRGGQSSMSDKPKRQQG